MGVDLVPPKCCSYDCIYCQVGSTTKRTIQTKDYVPLEDVIEELRQRLTLCDPDVITLSGSGEPTLNREIGLIIERIKEVSDRNIAILTNGSLLWKEEVRQRVLEADIIMPTLSTAVEATFNRIHRPHPELGLPKIIEGLRSLKKEFRGFIGLEVMLISGLNDRDAELRELKQVVDELEPDQVQLNTVVRPPADASALPLEGRRLEEIEKFFGAKARIISHNRRERQGSGHVSLRDSVLEAVKRRPLTAPDVARVLKAPLGEVESLLRGLTKKGDLMERGHAGSVYYVVKGS